VFSAKWEMNFEYHLDKLQAYVFLSAIAAATSATVVFLKRHFCSWLIKVIESKHHNTLKT